MTYPIGLAARIKALENDNEILWSRIADLQKDLEAEREERKALQQRLHMLELARAATRERAAELL